MKDDIVHRLKKRSWWDGSVVTMCGQRFRRGYYRESWFSLGRITCPGCKKQAK